MSVAVPRRQARPVREEARADDQVPEHGQHPRPKRFADPARCRDTLRKAEKSLALASWCAGSEIMWPCQLVPARLAPAVHDPDAKRRVHRCAVRLPARPRPALLVEYHRGESSASADDAAPSRLQHTPSVRVNMLRNAMFPAASDAGAEGAAHFLFLARWKRGWPRSTPSVARMVYLHTGTMGVHPACFFYRSGKESRNPEAESRRKTPLPSCVSFPLAHTN
jgi:hypothetical protein